MSIVMNLSWEGMTPEQYEAVRKHTNQDQNYPPGALVHIVSFDKKGIRVTDVWESEKAMNDYFESTLKHAFAKANLPGHPEMEIHPLHKMAAYGLMKG